MRRCCAALGVLLLTATCSQDDPREPAPPLMPAEGGASSIDVGGQPHGAGADTEPSEPAPNDAGAPGHVGGAASPPLGGAEHGGDRAVGGSGGEGGDPTAPPVKPDDGCSSGLYRYPNQPEGETMNPGYACVACHVASNSSSGTSAPILVAAGTVYPTASEPNGCVGSAALGAEVVLVDESGVEHRLKANSSGNFLLRSGSLSPPYSAKVVFQGAERAARGPHRGGDCNECHTLGSRIRLPDIPRDK